MMLKGWYRGRIPFVPGDERFFCLKELLNEVKFEWVRENTMIL